MENWIASHCVSMFLMAECVSISLPVIVLQTYSPTECISSPTCRVESTTALQWFLVLQIVVSTQQQDYRYGDQDYCILSSAFSRTINTLVKTSVLLVLLFVELSRHQSKSVCRQPYFLQDYSYTSQYQCIVPSTFCRAIDTLFETSVSQLLLFLGLLIRCSRSMYCKSYFL